MNWMRRLFGRDPDRQAKDAELARLEQRSAAVLRRTDRLIAEQAQLAAAVRGTVNALRRESIRR